MTREKQEMTVEKHAKGPRGLLCVNNIRSKIKFRVLKIELPTGYVQQPHAAAMLFVLLGMESKRDDGPSSG